MGTDMLYIIRAKGLDLVKVGHSCDPQRRISVLQTTSPVNLEFLVLIPGGVKLERYLHRCLRKYWVRGEWFDGRFVTPEMIIRLYNEREQARRQSARRNTAKARRARSVA